MLPWKCVLGLCVVVVALSIAEQDDAVSPLGDVGEGQKGPHLPLSAINGLAHKLQTENARLQTQNAALRMKQAVSDAKQKILIAAGVMKRKSKAEKTKKKKKKLAKMGKTIPPKVELSPVMAKGLKVINDYQKKNLKLQAKVKAEAIKIDSLKQKRMQAKVVREVAKAKKAPPTLEPSTYRAIPFFQFTAAMKLAKGIKKRKGCQSVCDRQIKCKSFSWSEQKQECTWSVDSIHYDPHYIFSAKATSATAGDPIAKWREFPGVKYLSAHPKKKENQSFLECQNICAKDTGCKSFSYKKDTKYCTWSSSGLSYSKHFNYYEKEQLGASKQQDAAAQAAARLKAAMTAQALLANKQQQARQMKMDRENKEKKRVKEVWVKNMPTRTQEKKIKARVQKQVQAMNVQLAAKKAKAEARKEKTGLQKMDQTRAKVLKKVSSMEAQLTGLKVTKKKAAKDVVPLQQKESATKAAIAKVNMKHKLNDIEFGRAKIDLQAAKMDLKKATKSQSKKALIAAKVNIKGVEKKLAGFVKVTKDLKAKKNKLQMTLTTQTGQLQNAKATLASASSSLAVKEVTEKQGLKAEKNILKKSKLTLEAEKVKAFSAKLLAAKSQERLAKIIRAKAKVSHWESSQELKHVVTDKQRVKVQAKYARTEAVVFKSNQKNKDLLDLMKRTSFKMARTKEGMNKAQAKVKKVTKSNVKRDISKKMAELASTVGVN